MAGISQGNVSNCLQGRAVRVESLHRLVSAFAAAVASAVERGVPPEHAVEIQKTVEIVRKAVDGGAEPAAHLARPGGAMPENASNRLERDADRRLLAALDDAPFNAAVTGPPECGKSTLLQLLAAEARRQGFAVTEFDGSIILPTDRVPVDEEDLSHQFFGELAEEVGRTVGESPKERVTNRYQLSRFLRDTRLRRPAPPLLIIVDHAAHIALALDELVQVCRSLDAQKGRTQMSWALEACDLPGDHNRLGVLSRLAPSPLVELGWLSLEQVKQLAVLYGLSVPSEIQELWVWFSGQPFLTHSALTRFRDLSAVKDPKDRQSIWRQLLLEIERGEGGLGLHLLRMKARLRQHKLWITKEEFWTADAIKVRMKDPAFQLFVRQFGIGNADPTIPQESATRLVKFYQHHLSRLL